MIPSFERRWRTASAALLVIGALSAPLFAAETPITHGMVAAAHPLAAEAGVEILEAGGNAMDAAVATAFALGVVEPYASGIGGGGFLVYFDAKSETTTIYDYREVAPMGLTQEHLLPNGKPDAAAFRSGGLAVAVPGMVRGLLTALEDKGTMTVEPLLQPAIRHAENGFEMSEALTTTIEERYDQILFDPVASKTFLDLDDEVPPPGTLLKQPLLAATLRDIATRGEDAVYTAEPAAKIADAVVAAGGAMTADDIVNYKPRVREPISGGYRGHEISTIGPPSSGGIQIIQALGLLQPHDVAALGNYSPEYVALMAMALYETETSANDNIADPAFHDVPVEHLLSEKWLHEKGAVMEEILKPAVLDTTTGAIFEPYRREPIGNTTHLSVVDKHGNIVALTQTINYFFGAGVMVPELGILMNNEMADFTYVATSQNFPKPGMIPRSSMGPMIISKDGAPVASLGSPGGTRIPGALVQIIVQKLDFGKSLQEAIDAPRIYVDSRRRTVHYESRIPKETIDAAAALLAPTGDWKFQEKEAFDRYFGGAQGIWLEESAPGVYTPVGAADPRRDGAVAKTK